MRSIAIFVLALVACVCSEGGPLGVREADVGNEPVESGRRVEIGQEFMLKVHEIVVVEDTHVSIFFDGVTEDSRCPTGVDCFWEGNSAVRLELSSQIGEVAPQTHVLNTAVEPRSAALMDITVRLVEVAPYPRYGDPPIDPASYVVTLVASRP